MTGYSAITATPSSALDKVKLDGLIPFSKQPYHRLLAFGRAGDISHETFFAGARSISNVLDRIGVRGLWYGMQKRGWIG